MRILRAIFKLLPLILTLAFVAYLWSVNHWTFYWAPSTGIPGPWSGHLPVDTTEGIHSKENKYDAASNYYEIEITPTNEMRSSGPTTVFIFTQMRSGSSFVGEIFNQHPGSFYLFEPLWAVQYYDNGTHNVPEWQFKLLQAVANCEFAGLEGIMEHFLTAPTFAAVERTPSLKKLCKSFQWGITNKSDSICPIPRDTLASVLNQACQNSQINVAKIIRIWYINFFEPIVANGSVVGREVKILHLIRDPRAVVASQIRIFNRKEPTPFAEDFVDDTKTENLCTQLVENVQTQDGVPDWLLGHYALIRYEDVAMAPAAMTEKLYYFLGTESDKAVFRWLAKNTNATEPGESYFSRKRNSRDTVDAWRRKLSLSAVLKIQNICRDALEMFGYRTVQGEAELTNLSLSLVGDMDKNLVQIS
ncbi:PREDICTED: carbohydrate sulfotransferase 1-like [Branchiostoma belcheri]|uniref:Sulfotransferase n=1 Tax=Branchiostoma belcheri TaxID=7741 RepID=A0A6P5AQE6_BRABE|nr:PREDICTED: carbohydrate sulfotransferase 1-like [Branchiostoma belcheri]